MIPPLSLVGPSLPTYSTTPALTPPNNKNKVSGSSASNQRQGYSGNAKWFLGKQIRNPETRVADLIQAARQICVSLDHMGDEMFTSSARSRLQTVGSVMSKYPTLTSGSELQIYGSLKEFEVEVYDRHTPLPNEQRESVLKGLISERVRELTGLLQELRVRLERTPALFPPELLQELGVRLGELMPTAQKREAS